MWDGSTNIGRLNLENVLIVNARKCGIYVAHTLDIATLPDVELGIMKLTCSTAAPPSGSALMTKYSFQIAAL